jgi:hypothetical protein
MGFMDEYKDMADQAQPQAQQAMGSSAGMGDGAELMKVQERYNKLAQSGIERKGKIPSRRETGRADVGGSPKLMVKVDPEEPTNAVLWG